jgi:tRNA(fMet)-specific endonuclease VapC
LGRNVEIEFMLDSNICIYLINNNPRKVRHIFEQYDNTQIALSSLVVFELQYGVNKSVSIAKNKTALEIFLRDFEIKAFSESAASRAASIRAELERKGTPIGAYDYLIAAHALELGATLITNNLKEFRRVEGLKLENWFA